MSKYRNRKVFSDGLLFDSQAEYYRYRELQLLYSAGELDRLEIHPRYLLLDGFRYDGKKERPIYYEADFSYRDAEGNQVVEDVKGTRTEVYKLKRKLFLARYGKELRFVEITV